MNILAHLHHGRSSKGRAAPPIMRVHKKNKKKNIEKRVFRLQRRDV